METALKILVVDDESGIVLMCQQLLELSSYEVLTATEAEQALAIALEQRGARLTSGAALEYRRAFLDKLARS